MTATTQTTVSQYTAQTTDATRTEAEAMLRDMAFVLKMVQKAKTLDSREPVKERGRSLSSSSNRIAVAV